MYALGRAYQLRHQLLLLSTLFLTKIIIKYIHGSEFILNNDAGKSQPNNCPKVYYYSSVKLDLRLEGYPSVRFATDNFYQCAIECNKLYENYNNKDKNSEAELENCTDFLFFSKHSECILLNSPVDINTENNLNSLLGLKSYNVKSPENSIAYVYAKAPITLSGMQCSTLYELTEWHEWLECETFDNSIVSKKRFREIRHGIVGYDQLSEPTLVDFGDCNSTTAHSTYPDITFNGNNCAQLELGEKFYKVKNWDLCQKVCDSDEKCKFFSFGIFCDKNCSLIQKNINCVTISSNLNCFEKSIGNISGKINHFEYNFLENISRGSNTQTLASFENTQKANGTQSITKELEENGLFESVGNYHNSENTHPGNRILQSIKINVPYSYSKVEDYSQIEKSASCYYTDWLEWSTCSVDCGIGQRYRTRKYLKSNSDDVICSLTEEHKTCIGNSDSCDSCKLGQWSNWSSCKHLDSSGLAVRTRYAKPSANLFYNKNCDQAIEIESCQENIYKYQASENYIPSNSKNTTQEKLFSDAEGCKLNNHGPQKERKCLVMYTAITSTLLTFCVLALIMYLKKHRYLKWIHHYWKPIPYNNLDIIYEEELLENIESRAIDINNYGEQNSSESHTINLNAQSNEKAIEDLNTSGLSPDMAFWGDESDEGENK